MLSAVRCSKWERSPAILLLILVLWSSAESVQHILSGQYLESAKQKWGDSLEPLLATWAQLLQEGQEKQEHDKLVAVNSYFNRAVKFKSDEGHWSEEDYWATPLETLGSQGGDCEDFVIAKYFSLLQMGVPQEKLRITYVKALKLNQAHMVLAYYPNAKDDPLILDNLIDQIKRASKRRDLAPVYSFNGGGLWLERERGGSIRVGTPNRLNMWMDLLLRMEEQGLRPLFERDNKHANDSTLQVTP